MASLASNSSLSLLSRSILPSSYSSCRCTSSCSSSKMTTTTRGALYLPQVPSVRSTKKQLVHEPDRRNGRTADPVQRLLHLSDGTEVAVDESRETMVASVSAAEQKMYLILEAVMDRVEMHRNIGEQRDNWNTLLLNSINMMTLTATALAGLAAGGEAPVAVKVSSTILFTASTGMLLVMNKIQPSQLAEEQRNAVRLFKQIESEIRSVIAMRALTEADVEKMTERVLALDRAYPLPLLGAMLEKFPKSFEPATWWPRTSVGKASASARKTRASREATKKNGWNEELEVEMRAIVDVLRKKDEEDYLRLGGIALKANKFLAVSGPVLTGIAAVASIFAAASPGGAAAMSMGAVTAGSLAAAVNTLEHGGQVGMVVEMYRNCAGIFRLVEESIETMLEETDVEKRENGEIFERKVALKLGRSLSQLRDLARKSLYSDIRGIEMDEFASKLF
ncbi:hypothetical protein SAY87_022079 [Trapa incisa]|uniref:F-box protein n=1 Tax=Trapa incisa TaxID=236973 RepID=A0AAN7JTB7_9MYRT|nr:hypothetical protein SAY87_022079 [Trapa incisa]